jgi:hypothetical protein
MANLDTDMVALIDQRIRAAGERTKAQGTCVTRDTTGPGGTVLFDGSTVAMPVKVLGNVFVQPGDRCVLDKYQTTWVVTGSFSAFGLGEASKVGNGPSTPTSALTSSTYVDLNEIGPLTFDKVYDNTMVQMTLSITMRSTTSGQVFSSRLGLRFTPLEGQNYTATDLVMNFIRFEDTSQRLGNTYTARVTDIPAGAYSVQVRWRRVSSTGTGVVDSGDVYSIMLNEAIRSSSPIL